MTGARPLADQPESDVIVVGGGLAGLTAAMGLCERDLRITLLEQSELLGGRARSWTDEQTGMPIDIGPHILLKGLYPNMAQLLEKLGTSDDVFWEPETFIVLAEGRVAHQLKVVDWPPPLHLLPWMAAHKRVSARDQLSNLPVTLLAMQLDERDIARLDRINASALLQAMGVTERYIADYWAFICLAIMNVPIELCSAGALLRFYQGLVGHNTYRTGFARAGLGNLFAPQARERLVEAGHQVLTATPVESILVDGDHAVGVALVDGRRLPARHVVSALPPRPLQRALPRRLLDEHKGFRLLATFEPCPYVSSYLWFDRKLTDLRFWARVHEPTGLNTDFYDLSNINPAWQQRPSVIASNIIYAHRLADWSDQEILAATLDELSEFLPEARAAEVQHHAIHRIPMGIPCPYPGMDGRRLYARTPVRGLYLAGDWTQTHLPWSMESAVRSGWLAAEHILADSGRPASLAIRHDQTQGLAELIRRCANLRPTRLLARLRPRPSNGPGRRFG